MAKVSGSQNAKRWGTLAEERARERYGLIEDKAGWHDATYKNGTPVEIKASQPGGTFRLWQEHHNTLARNSGYYVFVKYRPRGKDAIEVVGMKRWKAAGMRPDWYKAGHKLRGTQMKQYHLPEGRVF